MDKSMLIMMFASFVTSYKNGPVYEQQQGPLKNIPLPNVDDKPELNGPPKFCNGVVCPMFKTLKKTKDYEIRLYNASSWMTTEMKGVDYEVATNMMFMRLFRYISGKNEAKEKIPMTCPVLNKIIPGPGATCKTDFVMYFYNDPKLGTPPKPSDNAVSVTNIKETQVYVRQFGGFAKYEEYRTNALALAKALEADGFGDAYIKDYYYTSGYDSPFKLFNRHNEVWFMKK